MSALVSFYSITVEQYNALAGKDSNALYYLDNGQVYKGSLLLSSINYVEEFPSVGIKYTLYVKSETGQAKFYDGQTFLDLNKPFVQIIDKTAEDLDITTPTTGAVVDYVDKTVTEVVGKEVETLNSSLESLDQRVSNIELKFEEEYDAVVQYVDISLFPKEGKSNVLYIDKTANRAYRWDNIEQKYFVIGSNYEEIRVINGSF